MDEKTLIAKRVALELKDGDLVNLGIGLPTLVAAFVPKDADIFFQSENSVLHGCTRLSQGDSNQFSELVCK